VMRKSVIAVVALLPLLAGGCLAKTAVNVATLPVRATSKVVDWTTTSQSEADRNYGRKMRKQEAREGRELKRQYKECRAQNRDDCD
ncbi:hypothetical protein JND45_15890, partial [Listeria monocytogenes]|nr:hypothetical protein [Listeria monocytogenes]